MIFLQADVAHTKQQLNIVHAKVEEGERMVENARDEVQQPIIYDRITFVHIL